MTLIGFDLILFQLVSHHLSISHRPLSVDRLFPTYHRHDCPSSEMILYSDESTGQLGSGKLPQIQVLQM